MVIEEHHRWLSKLLDYDIEIQYRPRVEKKVADGLSGCMGEPLMMALHVSLVVDLEALRESEQEAGLRKIWKEL